MAKVSGQDEMELLSRVRRGAPGAARALYDRYAGHLSAVCARYIPSGDDRKDILQESFIKIFSSLDRFEPRGDGSLRAWMSRIVVNESLGSSGAASASRPWTAGRPCRIRRTTRRWTWSPTMRSTT